MSLKMDLAAGEKSVRQSLFEEGTSAQRSGKWREPCGYLGTGYSRWRAWSAEGWGAILVVHPRTSLKAVWLDWQEQWGEW